MRVDLTPAQLEKIWQLHLACEQRIGIIIVGPSGSGEGEGEGGGGGQLHLACEQRIGIIIVGPSGSGEGGGWHAPLAHL